MWQTLEELDVTLVNIKSFMEMEEDRKEYGSIYTLTCMSILMDLKSFDEGQTTTIDATQLLFILELIQLKLDLLIDLCKGQADRNTIIQIQGYRTSLWHHLSTVRSDAPDSLELYKLDRQEASLCIQMYKQFQRILTTAHIVHHTIRMEYHGVFEQAPVACVDRLIDKINKVGISAHDGLDRFITDNSISQILTLANTFTSRSQTVYYRTELNRLFNISKIKNIYKLMNDIDQLYTLIVKDFNAWTNLKRKFSITDSVIDLVMNSSYKKTILQ